MSIFQNILLRLLPKMARLTMSNEIRRITKALELPQTGKNHEFRKYHCQLAVEHYFSKGWEREKAEKYVIQRHLSHSSERQDLKKIFISLELILLKVSQVVKLLMFSIVFIVNPLLDIIILHNLCAYLMVNCLQMTYLYLFQHNIFLLRIIPIKKICHKIY